MQDFHARWCTMLPVQSCFSVPEVAKNSGPVHHLDLPPPRTPQNQFFEWLKLER